MAAPIKPLKIFCDIVRLRSFSRAARENDISQSAASQVVHHLEDGLATKLIDRSKRPFVLTPEGEIYFEGCRSLVERYTSLEERVRTLHEEAAGCVRVASIYSVGLHHMNRYLQEFLGKYPKANVRLEYRHPDDVYDSVADDGADIGLVSYPKSSRTISAIPWREEPLVVVCAAAHPLAKRETVHVRELAGLTFIGFDPHLTIRREIDRVLNLHSVEVQVVMEFDNVETIKRAVEIDAGVALLPEPTVTREVAMGTIAAVPLAGCELIRPLGIIHRRGKELSATAWRFVELLRDGADLPRDVSDTDRAQLASLREHAASNGTPIASLETKPTAAAVAGNGHEHARETRTADRKDSSHRNGNKRSPRAQRLAGRAGSR